MRKLEGHRSPTPRRAGVLCAAHEGRSVPRVSLPLPSPGDKIVVTRAPGTYFSGTTVLRSRSAPSGEPEEKPPIAILPMPRPRPPALTSQAAAASRLAPSLTSAPRSSCPRQWLPASARLSPVPQAVAPGLSSSQPRALRPWLPALAASSPPPAPGHGHLSRSPVKCKPCVLYSPSASFPVTLAMAFGRNFSLSLTTAPHPRAPGRPGASSAVSPQANAQRVVPRASGRGH